MYLLRNLQRSWLLLVCSCLVTAQTPSPSQPSTIKNCQSETLDNTGKVKICSVCDIGYYLSQDKLTCPQCIAGCSSCTQNDSCTSCNNSFYLSDKTCSPCITGCGVCTGSTTCSQCKDGFYLSQGICKKCEEPFCEKCISTGSCTKCISGKQLYRFNKYTSSGRCGEPNEGLLEFILFFSGTCLLVCACFVAIKLRNKHNPEVPENADIQGNELVIDSGRPTIGYDFGQQNMNQYPPQYPPHAPGFGGFPQAYPQTQPQPFPQHPPHQQPF